MSTPPLDLIPSGRDGNQSYPKRNALQNVQSGTFLVHQDELEIASERLSRASTATTKKFYRSSVTNVTPLAAPNKR
jgi:hypothetical protein